MSIGSLASEEDSNATLAFAYTDAGESEAAGVHTYGVWYHGRLGPGVLLELGLYPGHINRTTSTAQFGVGAHVGVGFGVVPVNVTFSEWLSLAVGGHLKAYLDYQLFDNPEESYGLLTASGIGGVAVELRYTPGSFDIRLQIAGDVVGPDQLLASGRPGATGADWLFCATGHLFFNWEETNPTPVVISSSVGVSGQGLVDRMLAVGLAF
jgi:hypothetical protein